MPSPPQYRSLKHDYQARRLLNLLLAERTRSRRSIRGLLRGTNGGVSTRPGEAAHPLLIAFVVIDHAASCDI
jgi:hypothetical protein